MAVIDYNYMSHALMHPTTVKVVLPENKKAEKSLYFLHGAMCDGKNCLDNVDMQLLADKYNMAIVIPDGGNAFYIDHGAAFGNYGKFVGRELVDMTRHEFSLPKNREDTAIAGFSMGGYGALRNGLKYNKYFGYIIALSPACLFEPSADKLADTRFAYFKEHLFDRVFKDRALKETCPENYRYLIEKAKEEKLFIPKIYLTCGLDEELLMLADELSDFLKEKGVLHEYIKQRGSHNWNLWSTQIEPAVQWFLKDDTGV